MSRGTAVPRVNEKLTLVRGCTFSRVIDSATRVRCWSLMLTEAFTFVDDCAEFVAVDGWLAGCCAAVFALPLAGACWAWLLAGGCFGSDSVAAVGGSRTDDRSTSYAKVE